MDLDLRKEEPMDSEFVYHESDSDEEYIGGLRSNLKMTKEEKERLLILKKKEEAKEAKLIKKSFF